MDFNDVVRKLIDLGKTISCMESCTGGCLSNYITNIEGASDVFKFSAVTYSNEYKIKMGVDSKVIDKYSVYSIEVAEEMSKNISLFTNSNYGIGITGKLNCVDKNNLYEEDNAVFVSIYDKDRNVFNNFKFKVDDVSREKNKEIVIKFIKEKLLEIIK